MWKHKQRENQEFLPRIKKCNSHTKFSYLWIITGMISRLKSPTDLPAESSPSLRVAWFPWRPLQLSVLSHLLLESPEKQNLLDGYKGKEGEVKFKELAHTVWRLASTKSAGQPSRLQTLGRVDVVIHVQRLLAGRPSSPGEVQSTFLWRLLNDFMRPWRRKQQPLRYSCLGNYKDKGTD